MTEDTEPIETLTKEADIENQNLDPQTDSMESLTTIVGENKGGALVSPEKETSTDRKTKNHKNR